MEQKDLRVEELRLDPENPRLPELLVGGSQPEILNWLFDAGVLDELAASMVTNGFFRHEPLIVLRPEEGFDGYVVLEGNRRFASLAILFQLEPAAEAELSFDFEVTPTSEQMEGLREVPTFIVETRDEVRKFLGFRHIGGTKTWSPEAKARYLDEEVRRAVAEGSKNPFRDVGRRVGSTAVGVRGSYIALQVLRSARENFGLDVRYVLQDRFGVWNRMMNSADIRKYIGFTDARTVGEVDSAAANLNGEALAEVISDLTPLPGQRKSVLADSRDVTAYAAVLRNPRARETLRVYADLSLARQVVERASLAGKVRSLARSTDLLVQEIGLGEITHDVLDATAALASAARTLHVAARDRLTEDD